MTSFCAFLLGRHPWLSLSSLENNAQEPHHTRNRLKKPALQQRIHYSDKRWKIEQSKSYTSIPHHQNNAMVDNPDHSAMQPCHHIAPLMKTKKSCDSLSLYSIVDFQEIRHEELRRTRAKTPVYRIGQLEEKTCLAARAVTDIARELSQEYQDVMPSRCLTPFSKEAALNPHRNALRRMKCHESLRDIIESIPENNRILDFTILNSAPSSPSESRSSLGSQHRHSTLTEQHIRKLQSSRSRFLRGSFERCNRRHSSDLETLIGSDWGASPNSPASHYFSSVDLNTIKMIQDCQVFDNQENGSKSALLGNDGSMQLCMDFLTNDLATALYKQHPAENGSRASGLQPLLMIEAYEALQHRMRKEMLSSYVTESSDDHVKAVEGMLNHWLQALRSIYERLLSQSGGISCELMPA